MPFNARNTSVSDNFTLPFCRGSRLSNVPKATARWRTADTKSPKRSVPSFRMCRRIKADSISLFTWKPTSKRASRNRSARSMPVFSFVCDLKAVCHCFRLAIKSRKSDSFRRPSPEPCFNCNHYKWKVFAIEMSKNIHQTRAPAGGRRLNSRSS